MKVYVDEMPNCCRECKYLSKYGYCDLLDRKVNNVLCDNPLLYGCPLHSLTNHDQQVRADERKKVVEEIRTQLYKHFNVNSLEEYEKLPLMGALFTLDVATEILDQVEKGENNNVKN